MNKSLLRNIHDVANTDYLLWASLTLNRWLHLQIVLLVSLNVSNGMMLPRYKISRFIFSKEWKATERLMIKIALAELKLLEATIGLQASMDIKFTWSAM